ncbi:Nuclear pore complex protein [Morus notabilis]|uniref:Nuclear pore complex protein n=1 Tax=Morus notabilis TaxID=981085 RepID=W9RYG0_9ROSA|nr:nucleoporin NUP100/NSP100 [Morus notabilis]EXC17777.1 Nuclear pore complex protein [Morus notabilis]
MKGTKRFAVPESNPASQNDSAFWNKRITVGSMFDVHRADLSQQKPMGSPTLNLQRAESSRQHVRALNIQFASWVQTQLKNHPDELWEDGVRDYLAHASNIMEKFTDVVNWLKANAANGESLPAAELQTTEKKTIPEAKNSETKLFQTQTGLTPVSTTPSFVTSWSSGVFSNNQTGGVANSQNSSVLSSTQSSGVLVNSQSSGVFSNSQSSGVFSSSQSLGVSSSSQSLGVSSNSQSSGLFSNSQSSGLFSNSQSSGLFSNSQSSGLLSNSQSSGLLSNSQSTEIFSNSQSSNIFSNNQSSGLFSNSQSSGLFSNNQTPFSFGNYGSAPENRDAADDADGENEEQPSSPSVKKSEEKGVVVVHEVKCKLYVKSSDPADRDPWKDKGTGQLSIKCKEGVSKGAKESKPTIIVRNDVGKLLLNALIYPGIKTTTQKNSIVAIFHSAGDGDGNGGGKNDNAVARTFLIRLKTEEDRNKLATAIQDYAPSS